MKNDKLKRYFILSILFFLPVAFLLILYPATHNYTPLSIVQPEVNEISAFKTVENTTINLQNHITILAFLGNNPLNKVIEASNIKALIYDKFKGFKTFQVVIILPVGTANQVEKLKHELFSYQDIKFWHFVYGNATQIKNIYNSLKSEVPLDVDLASKQLFIIDKDRAQRGRLDDRTDKDLGSQKPIVPLYSYNSIEIAEIKNKLSDDLRILFTEYRQKRKGVFNTDSRRDQEIKPNYE